MSASLRAFTGLSDCPPRLSSPTGRGATGARSTSLSALVLSLPKDGRLNEFLITQRSSSFAGCPALGRGGMRRGCCCEAVPTRQRRSRTRCSPLRSSGFGEVPPHRAGQAVPRACRGAPRLAGVRLLPRRRDVVPIDVE